MIKLEIKHHSSSEPVRRLAALLEQTPATGEHVTTVLKVNHVINGTLEKLVSLSTNLVALPDVFSVEILLGDRKYTIVDRPPDSHVH